MKKFKPIEFEESILEYNDVASGDYCFNYEPYVEDIEEYVRRKYLLNDDYSYEVIETGNYLYYLVFDYRDVLTRVLRFTIS